MQRQEPSSSRGRTAPDQAQQAHELLELIRGGAIDPVFQPITDLTALKVIGLEALSRPSSPSSFQSASDMFGTAARLGLLPSLEAVARRRIMSHTTRWPANTLLFLNASPAALREAGITRQIEAALTPGLSPSGVVIEVTESDGDTEEVRAAAEALRRRGFQIALDDLGAGSQDLRRVVEIRPDWIKLDRELIRDVDTDPVRLQLVSSLAAFATRVGCKVVAEGIERREELLALRRIGVGYAQGFLLARPCPSFLAATRIANNETRRLIAA